MEFEYVVIEQFGVFRLKQFLDYEEDTIKSFLLPWFFKPNKKKKAYFVRGKNGGILSFKTKQSAFDYIPKLKPIYHYQTLINDKK